MSNPAPEQANLVFLRRLVTTLTATMIIGIAIVIALMVMRLNTAAPLPLPERITLPDGTQATAFAVTPDYIAVTTPNAVLIYTPDGQTLRQTITLSDD